MSYTIEIDGYTISYDRVGSGSRNAVLLHGWGASKAWWHGLAEGLAQTHTCYLPDLLGFGRSTRPARRSAFHIEQQTAVIAALIERLDLAPVYLVGHSMGGMISVTLAHRYPHLVERLAVFDLVVTGRCGSFLRAGQLALAVPLVGRPLFALGQALSRWSFRLYSRSFRLMLAGRSEPRVREFMARTYLDYRKVSWRSLEAALWAFTTFDLRPFMGQVQQPALVVCGREDKLIPPEDSQLLAGALPHGHLEWFSPAGHNPFVEYPEQCLALLQTFANGHPASGQNRFGLVSYLEEVG